MKQHVMRVATQPFNKILAGDKVIESRLFDKKRQLINVGDEIIICENDHTENQVVVIVEKLFRHDTFSELFSSFEASLFGGKNHQELMTEIRQFYSVEQEKLNGVIGIKLHFKDEV